MNEISPELGIGTLCFTLALIHTFLVSRLQRLARRFPSGSTGENFFHLMGEVEVSFGLWAAIYILSLAFLKGSARSLSYLNGRDFTEAAFVFVIMSVCSTKPVLDFAKSVIAIAARLLPLPKPMALYIMTLSIGPLLGSFITEPAAMTVTALILLDSYYGQAISTRLKYATLGLLFVGVSVGGTLTPYAAPPVLMVAAKWNWSLIFMLQNFGWKAAIFSFVSSAVTALIFRKELSGLTLDTKSITPTPRPLWVTIIHLVFLSLIVTTHHHITVFFGLFLLFLGLYSVTQEYQEKLRLREGLLVAFFLGGIVVLGEPQRWWLEPLLSGLNAKALYGGAIALTAITDNAALAYLGSQIPDLSDTAKYALIAGSVVGGGLTVIANAPNPVGFGLLNSSFGEEGISPLYLAASAMPYTIFAALIFWSF